MGRTSPPSYTQMHREGMAPMSCSIHAVSSPATGSETHNRTPTTERSLMAVDSLADSAIGIFNLVWQRSTFCTANGCVEVAFAKDGDVYLRDSESGSDSRLAVTVSSWRDFVRKARSGIFDLF
jgi:hypothetical protein